MESNATVETDRQSAVTCSALLGCPWCGNAPTFKPLRYRNTGNVFGYKIRCEQCDFEKSEKPACWMMGNEKETMDEAARMLGEWWNARSQPNDKLRHGGE